MQGRAQGWIFPILSGGAAGFTLIARDFFPFSHLLVFFCYLPLWFIWLREDSPRRIFWQGWLAQAALTLVAFPWIAHTVAEFGEVPYALALGALALFMALGHLHIPIAAFLWARFFPQGTLPLGPRLFGLALFQAIAERLAPMLFDWHLGYAWYFLGWPAYQVADVVGFAGLGTLTLFVNGLLLFAWLSRGRPRMAALGTGALLLLALNGLGLWRKSLVPPADSVARALVVQPNIGNRDKLRASDPSYHYELVNRYLRLTRAGLEKARAAGQAVDFAVWPENAFPDVISELGSEETHFRALSDFLAKEKLTLLTGGYGFNDDGKVTNAFFVLQPGKIWGGPTYHKSYLLAFGEYLPGAGWWPGLKNLFPAVSHFAAGTGPAVLKAGALRVGPQICYEGLFDGFSRESARLGAEVLVNLTNDSWYGSWQEPWQHLYLTAGRAVETRRPLLRATNTGISTAVRADGSLLPLSPLDTEWVGLIEVPYRRDPGSPPFTSWGYWLVPGLLAGGLAYLAWLAGRRRFFQEPTG